MLRLGYPIVLSRLDEMLSDGWFVAIASFQKPRNLLYYILTCGMWVLGNCRHGIKASNNANKYYDLLRRKHKRIANIREDFLQKETTKLALTYQEIKIEDLNIRGMLANHKLANAISNLGLYRFRELLTYKQSFYGFMLTIIDRWFPSSKTCSCCGHVQPMPLKERVFDCQQCGQVIDRDFNASVNLERWKDADG